MMKLIIETTVTGKKLINADFLIMCHTMMQLRFTHLLVTILIEIFKLS
jgi:hypothetical protein